MVKVGGHGRVNRDWVVKGSKKSEDEAHFSIRQMTSTIKLERMFVYKRFPRTLWKNFLKIDISENYASMLTLN